MADIAKTLAVELRDREFSEGYSESFLDTYVSTQIKVLREQRRMTQKQLAEALGTSQTVVSRIEGAGYSSWSIKTLKKLARAFDVRLQISFETVGSLIDEVSGVNRKALQRAKRSEDPRLYHTKSLDAQPATTTLVLPDDRTALVGGASNVLLFAKKAGSGTVTGRQTQSRVYSQASASGEFSAYSETDGDWGASASVGGL